MNPQPDPASPVRSDTLFSDAVPGALKSLVDRYGTGLLGEAGRLRGLLQDEVPQAKKEISVLLLALEEHVPQDLMRVHSGEPISSLSPRLVRRLTDDKALSPEAARWAVNAWAQGLGVESVLLSQPAAVDIGLQQQDGSFATGLAGQAVGSSAANQTYAPPVPRPRPRKNMALAIGAITFAAVGAAAWWFTQPRIEIAAVNTAAVLVGNGKPHPVLIDFEARNVQVRSAELRLVKGEGDWGRTSWTAEVTPEGASRVAAGALQVRTSKPVSATFEVTLVGADGKRSAPFQRTFDVLPPLVIHKISLPRTPVVGQPFGVDIAFQKGGAEIVRIERKVVESSQPWAQNESSQTIKLPPDANRLDYRFDAFGKPTRSTVEFTLVDAAGVRSDPVRLALNVGVAGPPGRLGTVVSIAPAQGAHQPQQAQPTTGIGAAIGGLLGGILGNQVGKGSGRTAATVGGAVAGVWAGNEAEKMMGANASPTGAAPFDTTVRFDNGGTQIIRIPGRPRWAVGDRVSWNGRELAPASR